MPTPHPRQGAMMVSSLVLGVFDSVAMGYGDSIACPAGIGGGCWSFGVAHLGGHSPLICLAFLGIAPPYAEA